MDHRSPNEKYLCTYKCGEAFPKNDDLKEHINKVHLPYPCSYCSIRKKTSKSLNSHIFIHHPETRYKYDEQEDNFKCCYPNCKKHTDNLISIKNHYSRTHNENTYPCNKCDRIFKQKYRLTEHIEDHLPKTIQCKNCPSMFRHEREYSYHLKRIHSDKIHKCTVDGCNLSYSTIGEFNSHIKWHNKDKIYECRFTWCDNIYRSTWERNVHETRHMNSDISRKPHERRVLKNLKEWGYDIDFEITINASQQKCLLDTERYFSRLDFQIINCVNAILIVECDERQHSGYILKCELSRMMDVQASLVKNGYTLPFYWIRYSPNSNYVVGDQIHRQYTYRYQREVHLKEHIDKLCSPDYEFKKNFNIHYMFYNLKSEDEGPKILDDPAYNSHIKSCVTWFK